LHTSCESFHGAPVWNECHAMPAIPRTARRIHLARRRCGRGPPVSHTLHTNPFCSTSRCYFGGRPMGTRPADLMASSGQAMTRCKSQSRAWREHPTAHARRARPRHAAADAVPAGDPGASNPAPPPWGCSSAVGAVKTMVAFAVDVAVAVVPMTNATRLPPSSDSRGGGAPTRRRRRYS